jgi:hypothetical protein
MVNRYIKFVESDAKKLLKEICSKLINIHTDGKGRYFFGGNKYTSLEDGVIDSEIEDKRNHKIINDYMPLIKQTFKKNSNWSNMLKSDKKCANVLRWCIKHIDNIKIYPFVIARFPKCKTYMVKKYYLPDYCF